MNSRHLKGYMRSLFRRFAAGAASASGGPKEKKDVGFVMEPVLVPLFFVLLFTGLFLGDGLQPYADTFLSAMVLGLFTAVCLKGGIRLNRFLLWGFLPLLAYYLCSAVLLSDNTAMSVYSVARLAYGYLVFVVFSSFSKGSKTTFLRSGIIFGMAAAVVSLAYLFFPERLPHLPEMNLLSLNYGHNHVVDMLLLFFPAVIMGMILRPTAFSIAAFLIFSSAFALSYARAAIMLAGVWTAGWLLWRIRMRTGVKAGLLGVLALFVVGLTSVPAQDYAKKLFPDSIVKAWHITEDGRIGYWNHAMKSFSERPVFGSGPGTFYLQSIRFQDAPYSHSWFAHNSVLELLSDTGIAGGLLLVLYGGLLAVLVLRGARRDSSGTAIPLVYGIALVSILSLVDYVYSYATVSILVFAAAGIVAGDSSVAPMKIRSVTGLLVFAAPFAVVAAFYLWTTAVHLSAVIPPLSSNKALRYFPVYKARSAIQSVTNFPDFTSLEELQTAYFRRDPNVLGDLLKASIRFGDSFRIAHYRDLALKSDPKNEDLYKTLALHYAAKSNFTELGSIFRMHAGNFLPEFLSDDVLQHDFDENDMEYLSDELGFLFDSSRIHEQRYARLLYDLALMRAGKDTDAALAMMRSAIELTPDYGTYYLALAGYQQSLGDTDSAIRTLEACVSTSSGAGGCTSYIGRVEDLPPAQSYADTIRTYPY